ncbi:hypothetical protein Taro_033107 [Colocasia esculenta]|uniref:RRM domain-containing protein n=1 Tax=Colocasia esculenta TaxID=4460 RepID=A0A843VWV3_COLES|nr:hypothetical protein [Colocasia esculenta]
MASPQYRSRFGDTTFTKVFVGGLAWETTDDELRLYFEHFGEILEAVIITDKNTGRSKGYGFVTFRDPESARSACEDPNPVIDGRRANCNIASMGRPRPSPPRGSAQAGSPYHGAPPSAAAPPYTRMPAQMSPLPPLIYPPYGYVGYTSDYGYQQALYNPQLAQYYPQVYGPGSWSGVVGPPYQYTTPQLGYTTIPAAPRASFPSATRPPAQRMQGGPLPYQYPMPPAAPPGGEVSSFFTQTTTASRPYSFQLQSPPTRQQPPNTAESQAPQQPSTTGTNIETSGA